MGPIREGDLILPRPAAVHKPAAHGCRAPPHMQAPAHAAEPVIGVARGLPWMLAALHSSIGRCMTRRVSCLIMHVAHTASTLLSTPCALCPPPWAVSRAARRLHAYCMCRASVSTNNTCTSTPLSSDFLVSCHACASACSTNGHRPFEAEEPALAKWPTYLPYVPTSMATTTWGSAAWSR
jgi:hypothetical protein